MILISVVSTHENGDVPEGQSVVYVLFGKKSILDPENLEREGGGKWYLTLLYPKLAWLQHSGWWMGLECKLLRDWSYHSRDGWCYTLVHT